MKRLTSSLIVAFIFFIKIFATDYTGTSTVQYIAYHKPLSGAATHTMTGFVRFENGLTCVNYSSAPAGIVWGSCIPFSGGLDLRDTNSLCLIRNFVCENKFYTFKWWEYLWKW